MAGRGFHFNPKRSRTSRGAPLSVLPDFLPRNAYRTWHYTDIHCTFWQNLIKCGKTSVTNKEEVTNISFEDKSEEL